MEKFAGIVLAFLVVLGWLTATLTTVLVVLQVVDWLWLSRDPITRLHRKMQKFSYHRWPVVAAVLAWAWVVAWHLAK